MEKDIVRGRIVDHEGRVLAESSADGSRSYPYGRILAPVTGYQTERYGATGVEQVEGQALSGVTADVAHMGPLRTLLRADAGYDVRLTVDAKLSEAAWNALGSRHGAVVVMDASTGAVLTMVSAPSFDPASAERHWDELSTRADSPLLNRVTQGLYPPGSTFKIVTGTAALAEHKVTPQEKIFDSGHHWIIPKTNAAGEALGWINFQEAMAHSDNVYFYEMGNRLGVDTLERYARMFGLGARTGIDLPYEQSGNIPSIKSLNNKIYKATISYGYGAQMTFLQMLNAYTVFNNGGVMISPRIVENLENNGKIYTVNESETRQVISKPTADVIKGILIKTVESGTGRKGRVAGLQIGGKTGTARIAKGGGYSSAYNSSFFGFVNDADSSYTIGVLVREPKRGSYYAAQNALPIFKRAVGILIEEGYLKPAADANATQKVEIKDEAVEIKD